jgi:hypothetical protein
VDEAAEAVAAADLANGWCRGLLRTLRWVEVERAVRPLRVVVLNEDAQDADALEVAAVEDQQPVKTFRADGSYEALGDGVACGARTGVLAIRMPPLPNTSSNWPLYLPCGRGSGSARHRPPARGRGCVPAG